jgi:hypothetical protein
MHFASKPGFFLSEIIEVASLGHHIDYLYILAASGKGIGHPLRLCERLGYTIVQEYTDSGISGAKSHNDRPALDTLTKDTARRRFDMVMCWSIDRLGRSILIHAPKS